MKLISSFKYALQGARYFFSRDRNGKIELCFAVLAVALGFVCNISPLEWCAIVLCIGVVIGFEMLNAAIEKIADFVEPDYNPKIKTIKDVAAGAVLIPAVASLVIGFIIFLPKLLSLFKIV